MLKLPAVPYKNKYRFILIALGTLLFAGLLCLPAPRAVFAAPPAEDIALEITGEGVTIPLSFTRAELEAMEQYEQLYSTINTWPTKRWYMARGVKLKELLALAGIKEEATLIKFIAGDNYEMTLTVRELLQDKRYYFPGLKENHPSDGSIPGSTKDAQEVEPVLALISAEDSDDPQDMDDRYGLMLILGQRAVTEQTWLLYVKHLNKIELFTTAPEKWDTPKVNLPDGASLPLGTGIEMENKNTDADKIYYTTDGSTPTVNSPMFNWSGKRWWEQRDAVDSINIPIEIVKEMISENHYGQDLVVLKLRTIGPGKEDSEVVTYTFYIDPDAEDPTKLPGSLASGVILDRNALDLPIGHAFQLDATVEPFNALNKNVIWRSSDTAVATVDNRGLVTVVGSGTAVITAETEDGSYTVSCVINGPPSAPEKDEPPAPEPPIAAPDPEPETPPLPPPEQQADADIDLPPEEPADNPAPAATDPPEMPPGDWRYLAKAADLPAHFPDKGAALAEMPEIPASLQVFELSLGTAIPLSLPEQRKDTELYTAAILLFLFFAGSGKRYAEYTKEQ